jgi:hypothetical protein
VSYTFSLTLTHTTRSFTYVDSKASTGEIASNAIDYTALPAKLDACFEQLDEDNALRTAILGVGSTWSQKYTPSLLSEETTKSLNADAQRTGECV